MNSNDFQRVKEVLSEPKRIGIVTHRNPDGDAYGSSLALYFYLLKLGHEVHVISPNDCPGFLKWMPGEKDIVIFEHDLKRGSAILERSEVVFALDFNSLHRLGEVMGSFMEGLNPLYVMIDHHQEPDEWHSPCHRSTKSPPKGHLRAFDQQKNRRPKPNHRQYSWKFSQIDPQLHYTNNSIRRYIAGCRGHTSNMARQV